MNILERIVEQKHREVSRLPDGEVTGASLKAAMARREVRRDFAQALLQPRLGKLGLIAEVKKASPSAGLICRDFDPVRIASAYEAAGADCLSVLTDREFFQGSNNDLVAVRASVKLPILRKDFIIDPRQILEAIEMGADAILLIVAILDDERLKRFLRLAGEAGLAVLVEVHDEVELDRAAQAGAELIGINNRDLKTFTVDLGTTEKLARLILGIRRHALIVAESGIHDRSDVERIERSGAKAILVGEALVKHGKVKDKIEELLAPRPAKMQ